MTNANGIMELDGWLRAEYGAVCCRCLGAMNKALKIKIAENFANSDDAEQMDMYSFKGKVLDISKALNDNIILNLPMKVLCAENCGGLCAKCGADLNREQVRHNNGLFPIH